MEALTLGEDISAGAGGQVTSPDGLLLLLTPDPSDEAALELPAERRDNRGQGHHLSGGK